MRVTCRPVFDSRRVISTEKSLPSRGAKKGSDVKYAGFPIRPERSGTPSPESMRPSSKSSGGNVTGIRKTTAGRAPGSVQKTGPRRLLRTHGRVAGSHARAARNATAATSDRERREDDSGREAAADEKAAPPAGRAPRGRRGPGSRASSLPKRNGTCSSSATANVGMRLAGSRFRKSKISWPPGSRPVEKVAHETGVCAGTVGVSGEYPPRAFRAARFGSSPRASISSTMCASTPSNPRMTTRPGAAAGAAAAGRAGRAIRSSAPSAAAVCFIGFGEPV